MASIGLGLMQGAMLANQAMKENEELSRLKAGRKLWDAQLKEQEAQADMLAEMNNGSREAMKAINSNKERILLGDPTGTANVLKATLYKNFDGTVTVDPQTKEILAINRDGQIVGRQQPLSGMQGIATIMQLSDNIEETQTKIAAQQQLQEQRVYEMTKMREEKTFDYKKAIDTQTISANATMGAAGIGANATTNAAVIRGEYGLREEALKADAALKGKVIENAKAIQEVAVADAIMDEMGQVGTLDSTSGKLQLPDNMTLEQKAGAATKYRGNLSWGGLHPTATPAERAREGHTIGRSDIAVDTQYKFDTDTATPVGVYTPNVYSPYGMPQASTNPYANPANPNSLFNTTNNYGLNFGGTSLLNAQTTVQQGVADQAAAEADRKAKAYEMAKYYGFVK